MTNFDTDKNIFMGASKNWFATAKLSEAEPEQARKVVNNGVISHFKQRTMAMCHSQFCRKGIFRGTLMSLGDSV